MHDLTHMASQIITLAPTEVQNVGVHDNHVQIHSPSSESSNVAIKLDIEHAEVADDPRLWSDARKVRGFIYFQLQLC